MATIQASVFIPEVSRSVQVHLYFPTDSMAENAEARGVITLLHGFSGSGDDWVQLSAAGRYAYNKGYILICPSCDNSFYNNMRYGPPWYTILTEYLPARLAQIFKIPANREINYIAGLSMGGYGALRIALRNPGRYAAAASFSGALDIKKLVGLYGDNENANSLFTGIFGDDLSIPEDADLLKLAPKAAADSRTRRLRIFITCGKQDNLEHQVYAQNQNFLEAAKDTPLDITYREWDGSHEWQFWDRSLAEFIDFLE
ncbi:MAG: esterase family protein [Treponema sp.]|jgi:S-formylglutathione hydrolase FrmB|nr:esterase family protein [Treponema sp.]